MLLYLHYHIGHRMLGNMNRLHRYNTAKDEPYQRYSEKPDATGAFGKVYRPDASLPTCYKVSGLHFGIQRNLSRSKTSNIEPPSRKLRSNGRSSFSRVVTILTSLSLSKHTALMIGVSERYMPRDCPIRRAVIPGLSRESRWSRYCKHLSLVQQGKAAAMAKYHAGLSERTRLSSHKDPTDPSQRP